MSLYGRANKSKQATWREYVRKEFRKEIQDTFNQLYTFRTIQPRDGMDCYRFLKENFSQLNGKLYRSKANKNYLVLALMKCDDNSKSIWNALNVRQASIEQEMTDNEAVLQNIRSHFHVSEPFALDTELQVEDLPNVGTLAPLPKSSSKSGVLMVMMENYDAKSKNFLPSGKIAIGIKYTKDSMEIVEHLSVIGYVLFHHRNTLGQHLFAVKNTCKVVSANEIEADRYKNVNTTEMYLSIDIDTSIKLDASTLDSSKKEWTNATRYDAQYSNIVAIKK